MEVTDGISESIMRTVIHNSKILMKEPDNYKARAEIMWASSLSHNDLTGCGSASDWATHQLEHELSGMFNGFAWCWISSNMGELGQVCINNKSQQIYAICLPCFKYSMRFF